MKGKTILLLILVALAGIGLGAVGVRHIEPFFTSTQPPSSPRYGDDRAHGEAHSARTPSHAKHDEDGHDDEKRIRLSAEKITQLGITPTTLLDLALGLTPLSMRQIGAVIAPLSPGK